METLHAPSEAVLNDLDAYFDPQRAPDPFVPYLAGWVDLSVLVEGVMAPGDVEFPSGTGRLRQLIAIAAYLSRWRGTRAGVQRFLEVATGEAGIEIEENPGGRPFHLVVRIPKSAERYRLLIARVIDLEKPAHVTAELVPLQEGGGT
jgi:phage tail-like protein